MFGFGFGSARQRFVGGAAPPPAITANKRVLFIGDSTTVGVGASPVASDVNGSRPFSFPLKTRDRLVALGIPSIAESVCADQSNGITNASWNGYRPDVVVTGTLATSSQSPTVGGVGIRQAAGAALTFTSGVAVDRVEFAYPRASTYGVLALQIDGGTATTYSQVNATADYVKTVVDAGALATHAFRFAVSSGTAHGPFFINAWNSAVPSVQIFNAGSRNWRTADWVVATVPASPLNAIAVIDPDICVINLGINDYRQSGTTIAAFKANMQTIINACVAAGAIVILVVPTPISTYVVTTDAWSQAAVRTAYGELAATNSCALIDTPVVLFNAGLSSAVNPATWAQLNSNGHAYDNLHMKAAPYAAMGDAVGDAIKLALGL